MIGINCSKLLLKKSNIGMINEVVGDEGAIHLGRPGVGISSPSMRSIGDISFFKLLHDSLMKLESHITLGF